MSLGFLTCSPLLPCAGSSGINNLGLQQQGHRGWDEERQGSGWQVWRERHPCGVWEVTGTPHPAGSVPHSSGSASTVLLLGAQSCPQGWCVRALGVLASLCSWEALWEGSTRCQGQPLLLLPAPAVSSPASQTSFLPIHVKQGEPKTSQNHLSPWLNVQIEGFFVLS